MSRPRYFWYGHIQKNLRRYYSGKLQQDVNLQAKIAELAIERAIFETKLTRNGDEHLAFMQMLYSSEMHDTIENVAYRANISERTAKNWNSAFIYKVARYMGYL